MLKRLFNTTISKTLQVAFYAGAIAGALAGTCAGAALGYGLFRLNHRNCTQANSEFERDLEEEEEEEEEDQQQQRHHQHHQQQQRHHQQQEEEFVGLPFPEKNDEPLSEEKFVGPRINEGSPKVS